ncbi:transthyretin-like [Discoglossus pictus]
MAYYLQCIVLLASLVIFSNAVPKDHKINGATESSCPLMVKLLDAVRGSTAVNVSVNLYKKEDDGSWTLINNGITNEKGEIHQLATEEQFVEGVYKIKIATKPFWKKLGLNPFHEYVDVAFTANNAGHRHYAIAIVLTPYSFSTTVVVSDLIQ